VSVVSCDYCAGWIDESNLRWPGFCSPGCRDRARQERHTGRDREKRTTNANDRESS
jgi:hypothetical protein